MIFRLAVKKSKIDVMQTQTQESSHFEKLGSLGEQHT